MIGVRLRGIDGVERALAVEGGRFRVADGVTEWVDLRAAWSVPGLADCHAHLGAGTVEEMIQGPDDEEARIEANVGAQLDGGVLLVADKGSASGRPLDVLTWDPATRPELHMAGRILAPAGGFYPEFEVDVAGADLPAAVAAACGRGATWVKLIGDWPRKGVGAIPNYAEPELRAAVSIAHERGARVAIHTAAPETPSLAVAAGVDSIEHGLFLTATDVAVLGARGGAWVPTVAAMRGIAEMLGVDSTGGRLFADGLDNVKSILAPALDAGVAVLAGSDLYLPHGGIAEEAIELVGYGLTPAQAVATLTVSAYEYLGSPRALEAGAVADLVAFPRDPTVDITALREPVAIMRRGRLLRRP